MGPDLTGDGLLYEAVIPGGYEESGTCSGMLGIGTSVRGNAAGHEENRDGFG